MGSKCQHVTLPQIPYEPLKAIQQRALHILEQLGLSERANHLPGELSGGEQQRTAIARALLNQPDVQLLDEPTGNLDKDNRNRILTIVKELQNDGNTIILATHDPEVAKQGDREIYLRDGALQEEVVT